MKSTAVNKPIISFISQLAEQEQVTWLKLLSAKLPDEYIKLDKDLTLAQNFSVMSLL
jgi:hypothetical protein